MNGPLVSSMKVLGNGLEHVLSRVFLEILWNIIMSNSDYYTSALIIRFGFHSLRYMYN